MGIVKMSADFLTCKKCNGTDWKIFHTKKNPAEQFYMVVTCATQECNTKPITVQFEIQIRTRFLDKIKEETKRKSRKTKEIIDV